LCDDLARILDNDLERVEAPHSSHTITTICCVQDFNTILIAIALRAALKLCEWSIATLVGRQSTVGTVALVRHDAVVAGFPATIFGKAVALGRILLIPLPQRRRVTDEAILDAISYKHFLRYHIYSLL
jgi:hypothetical protein